MITYRRLHIKWKYVKWYQNRFQLPYNIIQKNDIDMGNCTDTRDQFEYRKTSSFWNISKDFKFFITSIKELIELSSRQVSKQASKHSIKAKQTGAKLMYNTRCYHAQRGTARSPVKCTCCSIRMNAMPPLTVQLCSRGNYARTDLW